MFARHIRRVANRQYRRGNLTKEHYSEILKTLNSPTATQQWENAVAAEVGAPWREQAPDWNGILNWIKAHWLDILRVFFALLPLLVFIQPGPVKDE